jgi:AAA+ ATPase superfamily predicted ATPase
MIMSITFINRKLELNALNERYQNSKAEFMVIYGRRRVGKTEIIKQFCKNKLHFYYLADKSNPQLQLQKIVGMVAEKLGERTPLITDWEELFKYLSEKSEKRFIFVIDEFPYLIKAYPPITSLFQKGWDEHFKETKMFLILCGSSVAMMKRKVLSYQSPLYGRRTGQLNLEPLSFKDSIKFFPSTELKQQINLFAIAGRIPFYLTELDEKKDVTANVKDNVARKDKILLEEPEFLLREELREPSTYSKILEMIAQGAGKLNDISTQTGVEVYKLGKYLNVLMELDYIERITPVTITKAKSKISLYRIKDVFFRFWYRFIFPLKSEIEIGNLNRLSDNLNRDFSEHVGKIFEEIGSEAVRTMYPNLARVGKWWGHYRNEEGNRNEVEIDICGINEQTKEILFGECKWQNEVNARKILGQLKDKAKRVEWNNLQRKEYYVIFARSFKEKIEEENVVLVDLEKLKTVLV